MLVAACGCSVASAAPVRVTTMRISAETTIAAPAEEVWKAMTVGESLITWCPKWKSDANRKIQLQRIGDVLDFTDVWGNGGRSVVTYLDAEKELRVAHEPTDGSYVCQAKFTLSPDAKGTKVVLVDQYTDEQDAAAVEATAAKVEAGLNEMLAALRSSVQGPE
jgi:uncharacterized protein YndB with AHSA1/START domain